MEVTGVSLTALVFSLIQTGVLTSLFVLRKRLKSDAFVKFVKMTILFLLLNVTTLVLNISRLFDYTSGDSLIVFNAISISAYLVLLNFNHFLSERSNIKRTPWLLVAIATGFGMYGLLLNIPYHENKIEGVIYSILPVLIIVSSVILVSKNREVTPLNTVVVWISLMLIAVVLFGSFLIYFEYQFWINYAFINVVFLIFSSIQYWVIKSNNSIHLDSSMSEIERIFKDRNLTETEIEIALMIINGYTHEEIATIRSRSYKSITTHASNIFSKMNIKKVAGEHKSETFRRLYSRYTR